jgi:hypothetical protein
MSAEELQEVMDVFDMDGNACFDAVGRTRI